MNMTEITARKIELIQRVTTPGYQTTERDVAESQELVNQYIDELERMEQIVVPVPAVTDIEKTAESILERWYPK